MTVRRPLRQLLKAVDRAVADATGRRYVLAHVRTPMHAGILDPVMRPLERDRRIVVRYIAERPGAEADIESAVGRRLRWLPAGRTVWARIDLFLSADPWTSPRLRRCAKRLNFFHGVAGKYDLDDPSALPIGLEAYDRVAFVNEDRMQRYLSKGVVSTDAAVLVGFPKSDALVNGEYDCRAIREWLGIDCERRTAIYAPTWSPASSLHLAGAGIVSSLAAAGWNVIVRPHARSLDPDPQYSGGIDWRRRLRDMEAPHRVVLSTIADASPLLAASDLMITDHSTIGFEFCLVNRPLIVFDAPDLARVARINLEKVALLRSAARVISRAGDVGRAADEEMAQAARLASARQAVARTMFYDPGRATARAVALVYELLGMRVQRAAHTTVRSEAGDPDRRLSPIGVDTGTDLRTRESAGTDAPACRGLARQSAGD
jgi:CDP-glycerol glycerophosphotransferase (TagB/SpsB family)